VSFLIVKRDWRANKALPMTTISPNTSNQNFEIDILFKVIEMSGNYVLRDD
jgi:hypothetical protein